MTQEKKKLGLVPKLIIGIIAGIILGQIAPPAFIRVFVTFSSLFSAFLNFLIPLMIVALITKGIADLTENAGKLLLVTVGVAYLSTLVAGSLAYGIASAFFPTFITEDLVKRISEAGEGLDPFFTIPLAPMLDVMAAIVFAFIMGIGISWLRTKGRGKALYEMLEDFQDIIMKTLNLIIIPLLPIFIAGNFANMSYSGSVSAVLSVFWKVFLIVIVLHLFYISLFFVGAGAYAGKNPLRLIKNQIPGYMTAVGTQSSAATIPVNVKCAEANGVSEDVRNFVVPLCATIHLAGSMITITSCATAVLLMYNMPHGFGMMAGFIAMLGVAMVAAPGAPGGAIMSALPFLPMVGITSEVLQQLMITLYLTQDSFGTAANVSGDNAIAVFVDKVYEKSLKKA